MHVYEVTRENNRVIVRKSNTAGSVLNAPADSYIVYASGASGELAVAKVGDLSDEQLLLALARAVDLGPKK